MIDRRQFFIRAANGSAALLVGSRALAQQPAAPGMVHDSSMIGSASNTVMDQDAALPVRLPPKNSAPVLTDRERDDLEHHIHCQCGCTLDIFTCRTTDFTCQVSPAMHRDVVELVKGGYNAQEIIDAFVNVYGQRALMAPKKSGFDLLAWVLPGVAVVVGGGVLASLLRTWGSRAKTRAATASADPVKSFRADASGVDATPDELRRLEAAVRGDDAR